MSNNLFCSFFLGILKSKAKPTDQHTSGTVEACTELGQNCKNLDNISV